MNIQLSHQGGNPPRIVMRCPAGQRREADELAGLLGFARTTVWNDASPDHAWAVVSAIPSTKVTAASVMEVVDYHGNPLNIVVGKVLGFRKNAKAPAEYTDVFFAGEDDPWKLKLVEHAFRTSLAAALEGKQVVEPIKTSDEVLVPREFLSALLADYDHTWPNEDAGTYAHRLRMLGFLHRLIVKKEGETLQQGEPPVVPRGTVPAWPSNLPFDHGQIVVLKDSEGRVSDERYRIIDFRTVPTGREYLLDGVFGYVSEARLEGVK